MSTAPALRKAKVSVGSDGTPADASCDHCGDPLAGLKVERRKLGPTLQSYCCLGCAFIAEQLYLAQAGSRDRAALDHAVAEALPRPVPAEAQLARAQIPVHGMVCAACALLIEHKVKRVPGVANAQVDFAGRRAYVAFDASQTDAPKIAQAIRKAGYAAGDAAPGARARRIELLRVLLAWLMMMQVMMLAVPAYLTQPGDIPADIEQLLRIAQLVLTLPVLIFSAAPIFRAALSQVRAGASSVIGMDLPIVLGLGAAFTASAWATLTAHGPVYFDSVTMFVALVLGARWLQGRGLARAYEFIDAAHRHAQLTAQRLRAWPGSQVTDTVPATSLALDDLVLVPAGETVPADGVVAGGASTVSQAWLTGESTPIEKSEGMPLLAGSLNLEQPLVVRVTRAGEATSLAALRRLVDAAGRERPRVVETANRVALVFLWAVLVIAAMTVVGWWLVDPAQALPNAIAVLVATCPCALSLAAPAALAATQSSLARRGVLTARAAALEQLAKVDTFACDKTGTLTAAEPKLAQLVPLRSGDAMKLLALAASMETLSSHPFARAIARAAQDAGVTLPALSEGRAQASAGVEAVIDRRRLRLGKADYALGLVDADPVPVAARLLKRMERDKLASDSVIVLADRDGPLALFSFGEALRSDAARLVQDLKRDRIDVLLVSGDRRAPVERVARELAIGTVYAHQTPESKRELVRELQKSGRTVAMLGDGMNDAPVIAQADVSIALAEGNALAQARADLIVLSSRLADVSHAFGAARRGMAIVRENLAWAFAYNVAVIPLAALGYITPALAAVGMAASSLLVVGNALRAARPRR
ncbi:MAG: heavy metal translocating P-type ATPase [Burkholderiaceae bacterium]|jgi:Cu2+-exporting ATPase|nr:heavy metal translocating P-type ATPase [Burkholderiaceae bacterium]